MVSRNTHIVSVAFGKSVGKVTMPGPLQLSVSPCSQCLRQRQPLGQIAFVNVESNPKATKP